MTYKLLINGELVDGESTMGVINPATEEVFATCPRADKNQLNQAVAAAKAAFPAWAAKSLDERRAVLNKIADVVEAHAKSVGAKPGRGVPDVATQADPGYTVYVDGVELAMGGTSAVAPVWAALTARDLGVTRAQLVETVCWAIPYGGASGLERAVVVIGDIVEASRARERVFLATKIEVRSAKAGADEFQRSLQRRGDARHGNGFLEVGADDDQCAITPGF